MGSSLQVDGRRSVQMNASLLMRKMASAARLPVFVLVWLVPVWMMIGLASLALALVPFRRLAPQLGHFLGAVSLMPCDSAPERVRATRIRTVIALAARYAPFRSNCFPQAIVAIALCRFYGIPYALHLGCRSETNQDGEAVLKSHAWVASGPIMLSGGQQSFGKFTTLGCWVSPSLAVTGA